jgi:hypothetical protein
MFSEVIIKGFAVRGNPEGELVGKWSANMHTMTHQAVLLGIPAVQLEIPRSVRALLINDPTYLREFARCILLTYQEVIVPSWAQKQTDVIVNYSLAKQVQECKLSYQRLEELGEEYRQWDSKSEDLLI